jgi:hypothetical protein
MASGNSYQKPIFGLDRACANRNLRPHVAVRDSSRQAAVTLHGRARIALFLLSLAIFFLSPVSDVGSDPQFSVLVSDSILKDGTPALNEIVIPGLSQRRLPSHPDLRVWRPFYQLVRINGRVLYAHSHGTSLLSVPLVAILDVLGVSAMDSEGHYYYWGELWIQKIISSFLMAVAVCIFFESACLFLPSIWSLAIAIAAGFGTQIWSTATRALWSHTWEVLLSACVVLVLLRREKQPWRFDGPLLATLLSWMYFVRPNAAITIIGVSIFILICHSDEFIIYAATGLTWLLAFLVYSLNIFGQVLPDYYMLGSALNVNGWFVAFTGSLISPSRGLFIFVPSTLFVMYIVARHWRTLRSRRLAFLSAGIICGQIIIVASWPVWWGGFSYGPRVLTDTIPWFVLLAILGVRAQLDYATNISALERHSCNKVITRAAGFVLVFVSIVVNGYGAIAIQTRLWNNFHHIEIYPERVWDWRHPQFLAGVGRSNHVD